MRLLPAYFDTRPWRARAVLTLAGVLSLLVLCLVAIRLLAASPAGRNFVEARLEEGPLGGQSIALEGLRGDLLGRFHIDRLAVSDSEGLWLSAEDVTAHWSVLAIASRHAKLKRFETGRLTVLREPVLPESEGGDDEASGSLPLDRVSLGRLAISELRLDTPLLDTAQSFTLSARADATLASGFVDLDLVPFEATGDRIETGLTWSETVPLTGELVAEGLPGGLIDRLVGPVEPGRIAVLLTGEGTPDAWRLSGRLDVDDGEKLALDATGGTDGTDVTAHVDLTAFGALEPLAERLGPTFDLSLNHIPASPVSVSLQSENLSGELEAEFSGRGQLIEIARPDALEAVTFTLGSARTAPLIGVADVQLAELDVTGALRRVGAGWAVEAQTIGKRPGYAAYGADRFEAVLSAEIPQDEGAVTARATLGLVAADFGEDALNAYIGRAPRLDVAARIDRDMTSVRLDGLSFELAAGVLTAAGVASADLVDLALEGGFAPAQDLLPVEISGLNWSLDRAGEGPFTARLAGAVAGGPVPETLAAWTDGAGVFDVEAWYRLEDGAAGVTRLDASTTGLDLSGSADYSVSGVEADFRLQAAGGALSAVSFDDAALELNLAGPLDALRIATSVRPEGLVLVGEPAELNTAVFGGELTEAGFAGAVELDASWRGEAWRFSAAPGLAGEVWRLGDIEGLLGGLSLTGDISGEGGAVELVSGALVVDGQTAFLPGDPEIDARMSIAAGAGEVDISVRGLTSSGVMLETAELKGRGTEAGFAGMLSAAGAMDVAGRMESFDLSSPLEADAEQRRLTLAPEALIAGQPITTIRPVTLSAPEGGLALDGALGLFDGQLDVSARQALEDTRLDLSATGLCLTALSQLLGIPELTGTLEAHAGMSGAGELLQGTASLHIPDLDRDGRGDGPVNVRLDVSLAEGLADITGFVRSQSGALDLNLVSGVPLGVITDPAGTDERLRASLTGGGSVAELWSFAGVADTRLDGRFELDGTLEGKPGDFQPRIELSLSDGLFEEAVSGFYLTDISLDATAGSDLVSISQLSANGGKGGALSGSGIYQFDGTSDISIGLDALNALQREDVEAVISGDLSLAQQDDGAALSGALVFDSITVDLDSLPRPGYTTLDVRFPDGDEDSGEDAEPAVPIALDITLNAERNIRVSNQALTSEWRLDARVGGTASAPLLFGQAEIVRGDVNLVGRNFAFKNSQVRLTGDPLEAQLDIRAERQLDTLLASIVLTGTASEPAFDLVSVPDLPDDEILSRVLFGRSPAELTLFQTAQLAAAVASFSGNSALDPVGAVQDVLGVDRLDFGISETGDISVGAGKYVSEDVYVELRSDARGETGLAIEWTPLNNIEVTTEVDGNQAAEFGIRWRRDFNIGSGKDDKAEAGDAPVPDEAPEPEER